MKYKYNHKNIAAAAVVLTVVAFVVPPCGEGSASLRSDDYPPLPPEGGKAADTVKTKQVYVNVSPRAAKAAPLRGKAAAALRPLPPDVAVLVNRFWKVAVQEKDLYGIPASIILAQILIETANGKSELFKVANNLFGQKCFSKTCKAGHCVNKTDDTHKDFFIKFPTCWASLRAHSKLITTGRYGHLKKLGAKNYKGWAKGLKKAGYATLKTYDKELIKRIEDYGLYKYDEL